MWRKECAVASLWSAQRHPCIASPWPPTPSCNLAPPSPRPTLTALPPQIAPSPTTGKDLLLAFAFSLLPGPPAPPSLPTPPYPLTALPPRIPPSLTTGRDLFLCRSQRHPCIPSPPNPPRPPTPSYCPAPSPCQGNTVVWRKESAHMCSGKPMLRSQLIHCSPPPALQQPKPQPLPCPPHIQRPVTHH